MLTVPPTGPPALPPGVIEVQVVGSIAVIGWPTGVPLPATSVIEVLAYLALHPGHRYSGEDLRAKLSISRAREWQAATVGDYVGILRRALSEHHVPEATRIDGYELRDVSTDSGRFSALTAAAVGLAPAERARHLADALALVRGQPFDLVKKGAYGWADADDLRTHLAFAVHTTATDLATLAVDHYDWTLAAWATERGFRVWPTDETLHTLALTAAAGTGQTSRLTQAWQRTTRLHNAHREPIPDTLRAHYEGLRTARQP